MANHPNRRAGYAANSARQPVVYMIQRIKCCTLVGPARYTTFRAAADALAALNKFDKPAFELVDVTGYSGDQIASQSYKSRT